MATVTYWIMSGTPCEPMGMGISGATIADAIADFKAYQRDCERFGNTWQNAYMEVSFDIPSCEPTRLYEFGPRGGVKRVEGF